MTVAFSDDITNLAQQIQQAAISRAYNNHEAYSTNTYTRPANTLLPPYDSAGGVEAYYADIPARYQPWSQLPDPTLFDPVVADLLQAMGLLRVDASFTNPVDPGDDLGLARQEFQALMDGDPMPDWTGDAAIEFKDNVLTHLKADTENQAVLIAVLKSAAEAQRKIWQQARADITTIGTQTLNALSNTGCSQNGWVMTFTVLAAVAAIAAVPLSGGTSAVFAITAIGAVGSIAAAAVPMVPSGSDTQTYSGTTAATIVSAMEQAMTDHNNRINQALGSVSSALNSALSTLLDNRYQAFESARPKLADSNTGLAPSN